MSTKEFITELKGGSRVESELLSTVFYSLVSSFIVFALIYFFSLRNIEGVRLKHFPV